jgi:hypothetical protein
LRQGKFAAAKRHAEEAVRLNPSPDNAKEFAELVTRCKKKQPKAPVPRRADESHARAFTLLLAGDVKGARKLAKGTRGTPALASLAVARYRGDGDPPVSPRAIETASAVLDATAGAQTRADVSARIIALEVLEDAYARIDPPPELGKATLREAFRKTHVERGGSARRVVLLP